MGDSDTIMDIQIFPPYFILLLSLSKQAAMFFYGKKVCTLSRQSRATPTKTELQFNMPQMFKVKLGKSGGPKVSMKLQKGELCYLCYSSIEDDVRE